MKNELLDQIENLKSKIESLENIEKTSYEYCIVRTYSAGVFAGELVERIGKEVKLKNARRLWSWAGAASLSQMAMEGTSKPNGCKFPCEVSEIILTEAIEIIPCTDQAKKSIKSVKTWKE